MGTEAEAHQRVRELIDKAHDHARAAQTMVTDLDALRVTGRAQDGTSVTLGHTGALLELSLSEELSGAATSEVERSLREANTAAQQELRSRVGELAALHYGEDSDTSRQFEQQYADLFPEPPPEEERPRGGPGVLR